MILERHLYISLVFDLEIWEVNGSMPTKWEHYVPRVYYRGFSKIIKKRSKEKFLAWVLDVESMQYLKEEPLDMEKFCADNNIYELRNKDGEIIAQNVIEKAFAGIEAKYGTVLKKIIDASENQKCLGCPNILSEEDKSILIILMTSLWFRDPQTINNGIKILREDNPKMNDCEARNFTLMNLLPLGIDHEWDENTIIRKAVEKYSGMSFQIGIALDDIITSDRPVIEWPSNNEDQFSRPKAVAFPLTSKLVLYLFPLEENQQSGSSCFFDMSEERINDIQMDVAVCARRWIFSINKLTEVQLERIKKGRSRLKSLY